MAFYYHYHYHYHLIAVQSFLARRLRLDCQRTMP